MNASFKKSTALVLIALFLAQPPLAYADAAQDLKNVLGQLREKYPPYLHESFSGAVKGTFLMTLEDYYKASHWTLTNINNSHLRSTEMVTAWERIEKNSDPLAETFLDDMSILFTLRGQAHNEVYAAKVAMEDLRLLRESWPNVCSQENLAYTKRFFNPINLFSFDSVAFVDVPGKDYTVQFGVTVNTGGQVTGASGQGGFGSNDATAAIIPTCTAIGAAIGTAVPGVGNIVGGIIGAVVGLIITAFIVGFENAERVRKINEQWDLIGQVREVQKSTVEKEANEAPALIDRTCQDILPQSVYGPLTDAAALAEKHFNNVSRNQNKFEQRWGDLKIKYLIRLEALERNYFPVLREKFMSAFRQKFERREMLDQEAITFITTQIAPRLRPITQSATLDPVTLSDARHDVWDQMIDGDAVYTESSDFTFSAGSIIAPQPTYITYWQRFSLRLGEKLR